ncbi:MAG: GspH/FimT family pseudopilin [Burkholderiales bacterium]|nr:GspH/FimT family pseudopilin [Burkholderiales bacterium]MDE1928348.1 GspH/FimT family pseudopilin [Burkholderiales bacterium]MDE2157764.1 GspH/FimT family pseudopilin [Burkholderiales bacterium]MDE2502158.1 GspH/FimT family pseudopilin [Burkholderiales bacterium]
MPSSPSRSCLPSRRNRSAGFTVIELMVVLAIAAVMLGLAAPGFQSLGQQSRSQAWASALVRDIQLARSTAIQTGAPVTLCAAATPSNCAANAISWTGGWVVYQGLAFTAGTSIIVASASADPNAGADTFTSTLAAAAPALTFNRQGYSPAAGAGVMFTFAVGTDPKARNCVVVTAVGIPTTYAAGAATPVGAC